MLYSIRRMSLVLVLFAASHGVHAQAPAGRLPQDRPAVPEAASRDAPITLPRDFYSDESIEGGDAKRFRLNALVLQGNVTLAESALADLWRDKIGTEVSVQDLLRIAARITARYRADGYVLSQAIVPQQTFSQTDARPRIVIVEGRIAAARVTGITDGREALEKSLEPLLLEAPTRLNTLERRLLLLNDMPGVSARATLRPSAAAGAADLEVATGRDREAYSLSVHNRVAKAVGPVRFEASAERRNLFGAFDRHALRVLSSGSSRQNLLAYSGDAPVNLDGTSAFWSGSVARSRPNTDFSFPLDTDATNLAGGLSHALIRSRDLNLSLRGSLSAYNGSTDADGATLSRDRLRVLRVGTTFDITDRFGGINLLDAELSRGLSGLGASREGDPLLQRVDAQPQFTKLTLYGARLQEVAPRWSLLMAVSGQYTRDRLLSAEQFGLGGELFLRAYDPAELLGDTGAAGKLEVRYNVSFAPWALTLYGYQDAGYVSRNTVDGRTAYQSALSTGLGVRVSGPSRLRGFVEVSKPHNKLVAAKGNDNARVFAGIGIDF